MIKVPTAHFMSNLGIVCKNRHDCFRHRRLARCENFLSLMGTKLQNRTAGEKRSVKPLLGRGFLYNIWFKSTNNSIQFFVLLCLENDRLFLMSIERIVILGEFEASHSL